MPTCVKLDWAGNPDFTPCAVGEPTDYHGLKVLAYYNDGTTKTIDVEQKMFNVDNLQNKERRCIITYEGQKLSANPPVLDIKLSSISAEAKEPLEFMVGEVFDRSRVIVNAHYDDGSSREIANYKIFPYQELFPADKEITFKYGRCSTVLPLSVIEGKDIPAPNAQASSQPADTAPPVQTAAPFIPQAVPSNASPAAPAPTPAEPSSTPAPVTSQPSEPTPLPSQGGSLERVLLAVSIAAPPTKQTYQVGEMGVDMAGGKLNEIYNDGSIEQVDMKPDGSVYLNTDRPGKTYVAFEYRGKPVAYIVEVEGLRMTGVHVAQYPAKKEYTAGEPLDLSGLILEAVYSDLSRKVIDIPPATHTVTMDDEKTGIMLSYEGFSYAIPVIVHQPSAIPVEILFEQGPSKTEYIERETASPNLAGAVLRVRMNNGDSQLVDVTPEMVKSFKIATPGLSSITVGYEGLLASCPITVLPRSLVSLELRALPSKTEYEIGEKPDPAGVSVVAVYNNGEKSPVYSFGVSPEQVSAGDTSISLSYGGKSVDVPIAIKSKSIMFLDWAERPLKLEYATKESTFSCAGGVLLVKYNDGSSEKVALAPEMVSGFRSDRPGPILLQVSYGGKKLPITINVKERALVGLRVVQKPRLEYEEGEVFDPTGLVVEALYTGGTAEKVGVSYLPYGPLHADTDSVMLVYQDKAVVVPVKVSKLKSKHRPIFFFKQKTAYEIPAPPTPAPQAAEGESKAAVEPVAEVMAESRSEAVAELAAETAAENGAGEGQHPAEGEAEAPSEPLKEEEEGLVCVEKREGKLVPAFYPSSFCLRFEEEAEEAFV